MDNDLSPSTNLTPDETLTDEVSSGGESVIEVDSSPAPDKEIPSFEVTKRKRSRWLSYLLIATAVVGLVLGLLGVIAVWKIKDPLTARLLTSFELAGQTLETTDQALDVGNDVLSIAISSVASIQIVLESTASTIGGAAPVVESVSDLVDTTISSTIDAAVDSLRTVQASAQVIDTFLAALASIPFAPDYRPETPLNETIGDVADNLESLPPGLDSLNTGLSQTQSNLEQFEAEVTQLAENVGEMRNSLVDARNVLTQYQDIVKEMIVGVNTILENLARWMEILVWGFTLAWIWLAMLQIGLIALGVWILRYN